MLTRTPNSSETPGSQVGINHMKFINENRHFMVATADGFRVCETASASTKVEASIPGGTALCDSYRNSNIFFFVGTGTHLEYPSTRLCIWNDRAKQVVGSVQFSPNMQIVDLHVLGDWVVVIFNESCKVFHFARGFTRENVVVQYQIRKMESGMNQGQVCASVPEDGKKLTLVFQDASKAGKVNIVVIPEQFAIMGGQGGIKENFVYASDGKEPITGLAISQDGLQLHVSVSKGTLLNTYSITKRELIKQLGRGKHAAQVNSISSNGVYLASCSDRGTTHLYNIASSVAESQTPLNASAIDSNMQRSNVSSSDGDLSKSGQAASGSLIQNTFSKLYYLSSIVPYYGHEFSFARLRNTDADASTQQIVHIGNDMVFMVTNRGNFYACPIQGFETTLSAPIKFLTSTQ